jgi:hypothetical protein
MKIFELKPLIYAAVIGAIALWATEAAMMDPGDSMTSTQVGSVLGQGAVVGALVQIGVRMAGVS